MTAYMRPIIEKTSTAARSLGAAVRPYLGTSKLRNALIRPSVAANPITASLSESVTAKPSLMTRVLSRTASAKNYLATGALAASMTVSADSYAGPISEILNSAQSAVSSMGLTGGLAAAGATAYIIGQYISDRNYKTENFRKHPGSPSPKRIMSRVILPTLGATAAAGALLHQTYNLSNWLELDYNKPMWYTLGALSAFYALKIAVPSLRHMYESVAGIQRVFTPDRLKNKLLTNALTNLAELGYVALFVKWLAPKYYECVYQNTFEIFHNIASGDLAGPDTILAAGAGASLGLLYSITRGRQTSVISNPLNLDQKIQRGILPSARTAMLCAGLAATAEMAGTSSFARFLVFSGFILWYSHGMLHATRSNIDARLAQDDSKDLLTDADLRKFVDTPKAKFFLMQKVAAAGNLPALIATYVSSIIGERSNWIVSNSTGEDSLPQWNNAARAIEMIRNNDQIIRDMILSSYHDLNTATTVSDALDSVSCFFDRLADYYSVPNTDNGGHPLCNGDYAALGAATGSANLRDGMYINPNDEPDMVAGKHIRLAATRFRMQAERLRNADASGIYASADLNELKQHLTALLDVKFRKHNLHIDSHAVMTWANYLPDSYNAKQDGVNSELEIMAGGSSRMEVAVDHGLTGRTEKWLIPTLMTKEIRDDQGDVVNMDSAPSMDNRFYWRRQPAHEIGSTHTDIAYIDDTAFYDWCMSNPGMAERYYPTADIKDVPALPDKLYLDLVYTNGCRQRFFGNGTSIIVTGALPADSPQIRVIPGISQPGAPVNLTYSSEVWGEKVDLRSGQSVAGCRRRFFYRNADFTDISDMEQTDFRVAAGMVIHELDKPHIKLHFQIPEKNSVPFDPSIIDNKNDVPVQIAQSLSWMLLRMTDKETGRRLFIPLNNNKENGPKGLFYQQGWKNFDEGVPPQVLDGRTLPAGDPGLPYNGWVLRLTRTNGQPAYVPLPYYVDDPQRPWKVELDLAREKDAQMPLAKFVVLRKAPDGSVTDKSRSGSIPMDLWQHVMQEPIKEDSINKRGKPAGADEVWVDNSDTVHFRMRPGTALPSWFDTSKMAVSGSDATMNIVDFLHLQAVIEDQTLYERFMPLGNYKYVWDPGTIV